MPKRPAQSDDPVESARHVLDQIIAKLDPDSLTGQSPKGKSHSRPRLRLRKAKQPTKTTSKPERSSY